MAIPMTVNSKRTVQCDRQAGRQLCRAMRFRCLQLYQGMLQQVVSSPLYVSRKSCSHHVAGYVTDSAARYVGPAQALNF